MRYSSNRPEAAFTVVELLVVILVIGLLSCLMFTALSRSKSKSESAACQGHLRQWGLALSMYLAEERFYPAKTVIDLEAPTVRKWHEFLEPYLGAQWPRSGETSRQWVDGDPRTSAASCPAYGHMAGFSAQGTGSYGYNAAGGSKWWSGGELGLGGVTTAGKRPTAETVRLIAESEVLAPSEMIAMGDAILTTNIRRDHPQWEFAGVSDLTPISWPVWKALGEVPPTEFSSWIDSSVKKMKARHRGRWNVVFVDGHLENLGIKLLFNFRNEAVLRRWNRDNLPHADRLVVPN